MPVHLTGRPVDMVRIQQVVDRHGLEILEDARKQQVTIHGQRVVAWGAASSLPHRRAFRFWRWHSYRPG